MVEEAPFFASDCTVLTASCNVEPAMYRDATDFTMDLGIYGNDAAISDCNMVNYVSDLSLNGETLRESLIIADHGKEIGTCL